MGRLDDGTPYFAPLRELPRDPDEDLVQCHLCGEWFRFLGSTHLRRTHGWTLARYREAFQLRESISTCSRAISEKHRQHAKRRVKAGEFGTTVHLVAAAAARSSSGDRRLPRWRSLAVNHPGLLAELEPSRNGDLDPYAVAAGSNRTLWWRCEHGHGWRASVNNRVNGSGCPTCAADAGVLHLRALARAQTRVSAERSLAVKYPELLTELHATRNGDLDPAAIGAASKRKLWWRCARVGMSGRRRSPIARFGAPAARPAPASVTRVGSWSVTGARWPNGTSASPPSARSRSSIPSCSPTFTRLATGT